VQGEWSRQRGFGRIYDEFVEFAPFFKEQTNSFDANLDKATFEEDFGLRYTKIPFTVLYADARFEQEDIGQREEELEANQGGQVFLRDTDATSDLKEYRVGFNVSPWQRVSLQAHYKHSSKDSDYDNPTDQLAGVSPGNGYSAFIRRRTIETDEMEAKLVLRPNAWLKTSLSYRQIATDFDTTTDSAKGFGPLVASPVAKFSRAIMMPMSIALTPRSHRGVASISRRLCRTAIPEPRRRKTVSQPSSRTGETFTA
jgi:hypothetical protein